jgi:peptidyl-prolyl cis-trans isomerase D
MISKIRKYQDSWLTKAILALTALSFMSLFGITGYVNSANKNRAVIKVDNLEILQDEMNVKLNNSIRKAKNMFGDSIEVTDEIRKSILLGLIKENLNNMIISRAANKENVSISDELIQKIISTQPEFMDASGRFNPEFLRRQLSYFDMSEQEYISDLKQNIINRHIVSSPVENIAFPRFMDKYVAQIENQQKVFSYITVNPANLKIDRKISDEEIQQYYQDFAPQFEETEKRDISFIELKVDDLSKNITPSDEEISDFYKENESQYVIPEKRFVLQMVLDSKENADKALSELQKGNDFYKVASDIANQDRETTTLGNVTSDSLLPELNESVFTADANKIVGPINSEFGWHLLKVTKITPQKVTPIETVKNDIINSIRQERAYEEALNIINEIEDRIGGGETLETIAKDQNVKINKVSSLKEDGSYKSLTNNSYKNIITSSDFIETAFSYNIGEISQVIETENGFILAGIDKIEDAHTKPLDDVKDEIIKIWTENEKSAIAQEIINDVVADLDNGESLKNIASRFKLNLITTKPLKRGEEFAKLNSAQLAEAYQTPIGEYRLLSSAGTTSIITPLKVVNNNIAATQNQLDKVNKKMQKIIEQDLGSELVNDYSKKMDVRVKYRLMGFDDL